MRKRALILGVGGQDGSYCADLLLSKGYEVHGVYRKSSSDNLWRLKNTKLFMLHKGDLFDPVTLTNIIEAVEPSEVYNFADQDNTGWSTETPCYSAEVTTNAVVRLLDTCENMSDGWKIKFFQPLSITMFGNSPTPWDESSKLDPQTPYAVAKACTWQWCKYYRTQGLDVRCAIFGNHDSPRRRGDYLLQTICRQALEVKAGKRKEITLRDPEAVVDVGYAPEYVEAAWRLVQSTESDLMIGTGKAYLAKDIANYALGTVSCDSLGSLSFRQTMSVDLGHYAMNPVKSDALVVVDRIIRDKEWLKCAAG